MVSDLAGPGSHILLIGSARHVTGSLLPELPSVTTTVDDLSEVLIERCGVPAGQITTVMDAANPVALADAIEQAAEQAGDVFLLYYVGHGVIGGDGDGELYLATQATVDMTRGRAGHQALAFAEVTALLRERCQARRIVAVIDACHAGRAAVPQLGKLYAAFDRAGQGSCLLASASRDEHALAPLGARHTTFTGALIDLLGNGDTTIGPQVTVDAVVRALDRMLPAQGMPAPRWWAVDQIGDLVLADNPAYRPPTAAAPALPDGLELVEDGRPVCPYPGLRAFTQADSRFFHGRTDLITTLVDRVRTRAETGGSPLFVVGSSGSGKSSLIGAGLLPALARGQASDGISSRWPALTFAPGSDPMGRLADILAGPALADPVKLRVQLTDEPGALPELLRTILPQSRGTGESRLLLVVDQFEELFASGQDSTAQQAFVAALTAAAAPRSGSGPAAIVIAVMRADFVGHASAFPELADALGRDLLAVGAMAQAHVRTAIEQPARLAGLGLDEGLADLILADLGAGQRSTYNPGALPLLGHVLYETWRRRTGRILTVAAYREAGSIGGALADTAETLYSSLTTVEQALCRRVFVRLVNPTDRTRRTLPQDSLLTPDSQVAQPVLDQLTAARLLTVDRAARGGDTVTITHEALIDNWPRLRKWIDEDQQLEYITQDIEPDAQRWYDDLQNSQSAVTLTGRQARQRLKLLLSPPRADLLYSDRLLAGTEQRLAGRSPTDPTVEKFLTASRKAAHRRRQRRRAGLSGLVFLVVVSVVAAGVAFVQYSIANEQKRQVIVRGLVAKAEALRSNDPHRALQLNVAADHLNSTSETRAGISSTLTYGYRNPPLDLPGHGVSSVAFSPDRQTLAVSTEGAADEPNTSTVTLWDMANPAMPRKLSGSLTIDNSASSTVAFSSDGKILAGGGAIARYVEPDHYEYSGSLTLWDVKDRRHPRRLGEPIRTPSQSVDSLAFSPVGHTLAIVNDDGDDGGSATLWNVEEPAHPRQVGSPLDISDGYVSGAAFAPKGDTLAIFGSDSDKGIATLWDVTDPNNPYPLSEPLSTPGSGIRFAEFSRDGRTLATAGRAADPDDNTNTVALWDVTDRKNPSILGNPLSAPEGNLASLALSPDGHTLVTAQGNRSGGDSNNTVALWDIANREAPLRLGESLAAPGRVSAAAFSPDGRVLVAGGTSVTSWDMRYRAAPRKLERFIVPKSLASSLIFSPEGHTLAVLNQKPIDIMMGTWTLNKRSREVADSPYSLDSYAALWNFEEPQNPRQISNLLTARNERAAVTFSHDGHILATNSNDSDSVDGTMTLWNVEDPNKPQKISQPVTLDNGAVDSLTFSPKGRTLAVASFDFDSKNATVTLWDLTDPKRPTSFRTPITVRNGNSVKSLVFSPDGHTLAVASGDMKEEELTLWNVTDPAAPHRMGEPHTSDSVGPLAFSPDGRILAAAGFDSREAAVTLWDVTEGKARRLDKSLPASDRVKSVVFPRNGHILGAGDADGKVTLWNVEDPDTPHQLGQPLTGTDGEVDSLVFSPDGHTLAAAGAMGTIVMWDMTDQEAAARLGQPLTTTPNSVTSLVFSPNGRTLAAGSYNPEGNEGAVTLWDMTVLTELRDNGKNRACGLLDEGLPPDQWATYIPDLPYEKTCTFRTNPATPP